MHSLKPTRANKIDETVALIQPLKAGLKISILHWLIILYYSQNWLKNRFLFLSIGLLKMSFQKDLNMDRKCEFWLQKCIYS